MANPEHLAILKQGAEVWNRWREEYPGIRPVFREADLSGDNLTNVNLARANLIQADLQGTILYNANLCQADLTSTAWQQSFIG